MNASVPAWVGRNSLGAGWNTPRLGVVLNRILNKHDISELGHKVSAYAGTPRVFQREAQLESMLRSLDVLGLE